MFLYRDHIPAYPIKHSIPEIITSMRSSSSSSDYSPPTSTELRNRAIYTLLPAQANAIMANNTNTPHTVAPEVSKGLPSLLRELPSQATHVMPVLFRMFQREVDELFSTNENNRLDTHYMTHAMPYSFDFAYTGEVVHQASGNVMHLTEISSIHVYAVDNMYVAQLILNKDHTNKPLKKSAADSGDGDVTPESEEASVSKLLICATWDKSSLNTTNLVSRVHHIVRHFFQMECANKLHGDAISEQYTPFKTALVIDIPHYKAQNIFKSVFSQMPFKRHRLADMHGHGNGFSMVLVLSPEHIELVHRNITQTSTYTVKSVRVTNYILDVRVDRNMLTLQWYPSDDASAACSFSMGCDVGSITPSIVREIQKLIY